MSAVILTGNQASYPTPDDDIDVRYDPDAIIESLTASVRSPLKIAPTNITDRLVALLQNPEELYGMFEHVATGGSLATYASQKRISYYALTALYESPTHPFITMRKMASLAISREDRERARAAIREKSEEGEISEDRSRYAQRMLDLAKSENPDQFQPTQNQKTVVQVGVNFGSALGAKHRQSHAQAAVRVIEHQPTEDAEIVDSAGEFM